MREEREREWVQVNCEARESKAANWSVSPEERDLRDYSAHSEGENSEQVKGLVAEDERNAMEKMAVKGAHLSVEHVGT